MFRTRAYRRHVQRTNRDRAKRLATRKGPYYPWRGYYEDEHVKYPPQTSLKRLAKRRTNKIIRRAGLSDHIPQNSGYRRVYDYYWEIL